MKIYNKKIEKIKEKPASAMLHTYTKYTTMNKTNTQNQQHPSEKQTGLIMFSIYCSACPSLRDSISIYRDQPQLCAVKPLQVWQECFSKHDINIH
jgi:hypothetical protein